MDLGEDAKIAFHLLLLNKFIHLVTHHTRWLLGILTSFAA